MLHRQTVCKFGILEPFGVLETRELTGDDVDEKHATFKYLSY